MIDKLAEHVVPGSKIGLGYMYCDYRDQKQQTTENVLGALMILVLRVMVYMAILTFPWLSLQLFREYPFSASRP